jgi:hypothetical protein
LKSLISPLAIVLMIGGGSLIAQDWGDWLPPGAGDAIVLPCGMECIQPAMEAAQACREAGGDLLACSKAFFEALQACRAAAGCETPERPPICGEECLTAARDAAKACHEAGGDMEACFLAIKDQLKACLEAAGCEVPTPPETPEPPCGMSCIKDSVAAARDCFTSGGDLLSCAETFREALEACRAAAGCGSVEVPDQGGGGGDVETLALLLEKTFIRGDANQDGEVNITDPIEILVYLFNGGAAPECQDMADASDDGMVDIGDPIIILGALFQGTANIPAPFPAEGFDPTDDGSVCGMP